MRGNRRSRDGHLGSGGPLHRRGPVGGTPSGISVLFAKAGDGINNAQRNKDFEGAQALERRISALEEIRLERPGYNYSAVAEAMIQSGSRASIRGGRAFNPGFPRGCGPGPPCDRGILDLH